ncbi:hypothetical protein D3C72_1426900 [compost metagenome]
MEWGRAERQIAVFGVVECDAFGRPSVVESDEVRPLIVQIVADKHLIAGRNMLGHRSKT